MAVLQYLMMGTSMSTTTVTGELWTMGENNDGQLGLGDVTRRSEPIQVGSLTDWQNTNYGHSNRHMATVKSDGTLWTWGYNQNGQLGLGDTHTKRSSPVQVGSDTDWAKAYTNHNVSSAIKTDGTLYTWGQADYGSLGHDDTTQLCSPGQVGSDTDWAHVIPSPSLQMMAMRTDGTLWWWGAINPLQGGDLSSPVQLGSATDWKDARCVGNNGLEDNAYVMIRE